MLNAKLPRFIKLKHTSDLIRVGRNNDGGYLISKDDMIKSNTLLGLGINDDWSFEKNFYNLNKKIKLYAYDASIDAKVFFKNFLKSLIRVDKPKIIYHWLKVLFSYLLFFNNKNRFHIKKFVGLDSRDKIYCSLDSILNSKNNIFIKSDIEGSEYRILNSLLKYQDKLTGLVIEFHDCDLHLDRIRSFLKKFKLNVIHVHANNWCSVRKSDMLPLVIEITFSRSKKFIKKIKLPHYLDMPNNPSNKEIKINL